MRLKLIAFTFIIPLFLLLGCTRITKEELLNQARSWLNSKEGPTKMNIEGEWSGAGWRGGTYIQKDNRITGTMEMYSVEGVINGESVYLIALNNGYIYFTIIMRLHDINTLTGKYGNKLIANESEMSDNIILKRITNK